VLCMNKSMCKHLCLLTISFMCASRRSKQLHPAQHPNPSVHNSLPQPCHLPSTSTACSLLALLKSVMPSALPS
jgi:hypothetical protein